MGRDAGVLTRMTPPPPQQHLFQVLEAPLVDDTEDRDASQGDTDLPGALIDSQPDALLEYRQSFER